MRKSEVLPYLRPDGKAQVTVRYHEEDGRLNPVAVEGVLVSTQDVTIRRWAERENNIVHWTELDHGGHFAALEAPDAFVSDVRQFFRGVSFDRARH